MEITLVIHTFNDQKGGKEIFTWNLVKQLLTRGVTIHVVAHEYQAFHHPDIHFHRVPMFGKFLGIHRWVFARMARRVVDQLDTDLVFTHGKTGYGDVIRIGGLPLVRHLKVLKKQEEPGLSTWIQELRQWVSLSKTVSLHLEEQSFAETEFRRAIVASEYLRDELLEAYPSVDPDRVAVIYNGFDPGRFNLDARRAFRRRYRDRLFLSGDEEVLIFVGNNFKLKGLTKALDYLRENPDLRMIVVGRGDPPSLEPSLDERIRWVGEQREVTPYYAAADCLILPTLSDGFGMVVLEAMAMGIPSMVSTRAGAAELIDRDWKGIVFEDNPAGVDFDRVRRHLNRKDRLRRSAFARQFSWDRVADRYLNVLGDAAESNPS